MSESVKAFRAAMRELDCRIPKPCEAILEDAEDELRLRLAATAQMQLQAKRAREFANDIERINHHLQDANRELSIRLKGCYAEIMQLKAECESVVDRYNRQRSKLIQVVNANDELAVQGMIAQKALVCVLGFFAPFTNQLTLEQKSELDLLTSGSFSDRLREEALRELREKINK